MEQCFDSITLGGQRGFLTLIQEDNKCRIHGILQEIIHFPQKTVVTHFLLYKMSNSVFFDIAEDIIETEMLFAVCIRLKSFP